MAITEYRDIRDEDWQSLRWFLRRVQERLDKLEGHGGESARRADLDMDGNLVKGGPTSQLTAEGTDYITKNYLQSTEAARAINKLLKSGGRAPLPLTRLPGKVERDTDPPVLSTTAATLTKLANGNIQVAWSAATDPGSGVSHYNIYRGTTSTLADMELIHTHGSSETPYQYEDIGLTHGTTYYYSYTAVDNQGNETVRTATSPTSEVFGDAVVPDAPTLAAVKKGRFSVLLGVEEPVASAGWINVTKVTVEVSATSNFAVILDTLEQEGQGLKAVQFTYVTDQSGTFFARARATNANGDSSNSSTLQFSTDAGLGDTGVPGAPTVTLENKSDDAVIPNGYLRAKVDFSGISNNKGIWLAAIQIHTSGTMTNPEASPLYTPPGDQEGTIATGGSTFEDTDATFPSAGSIVGKNIMLSYDSPWPGSPATNVFLAGIAARDSATQLSINGVWSQDSGSYRYRLVNTLEDVDSGTGFVPFELIYDQGTRDKGFVYILWKGKENTNYYARGWVSNTHGRSDTQSAVGPKNPFVAPNGSFASLSTPANTINDDMSADIQITWSYTKGTIGADGIEIMVNSSTGLPGAITEANAQHRFKQGLKQASGAQTEQFVLKGVDPTHSYSFAVRAYKEIEGQLVYDSITDTTNWRNHQPGTQPKGTDVILTDGSVVSFDQVAGKEVLTWVSRITTSATGWSASSGDDHVHTTSTSHGQSNTPVALMFSVQSTIRYPMTSIPRAGLAGAFGSTYDVSSATSTTVTVADNPWSTNQWAHSNVKIRIVAGTGAGQERTITSNTSNQVTTSAWTTTPDSSSDFILLDATTSLGSVLGGHVTPTQIRVLNPGTSSATAKVYIFKENASF